MSDHVGWSHADDLKTARSLEQIDSHMGGVLLMLGDHRPDLSARLAHVRAELEVTRRQFTEQVQTVCTGNGASA